MVIIDYIDIWIYGNWYGGPILYRYIGGIPYMVIIFILIRGIGF